MPEIMGSGAALVDYDNDGDLDIYLVQGAPAPPPGAGKPVIPLPDGWKPGNRLFRNNLVPSGKLAFTDVTKEAGVGHIGQGMGVAAGDYDNDGNIDLYVTNYGRVRAGTFFITTMGTGVLPTSPARPEWSRPVGPPARRSWTMTAMGFWISPWSITWRPIPGPAR